MPGSRLFLDSDSEKGSLILMALMILMVLMILGTAIIGIASMENKVSHYAYKVQQAQQAADAGVEWAIEKIYQDELKDRHDQGIADVPFGDIVFPMKLGIDSGNPGWTITDFAHHQQNGCYFSSFKSTGVFEGVSKSVGVTVVYSYHDEYEGHGPESVFKLRTYQRGQISSYIVE